MSRGYHSRMPLGLRRKLTDALFYTLSYPHTRIHPNSYYGASYELIQRIDNEIQIR